MSRSSMQVLLALVVLGTAPLVAGPDHWTALGPEGGSIDRLTASPAAPGTVWAISQLGTVFKTTDGAERWKPVPSLQARSVFSIVPDPSNASIVYAWSAREGYLKSTDGGRSWSVAFEGQERLSSLTVAPSRPSTLYAFSHDHIVRSTDGGGHWSALSELHRPWSLAVSPTDPDTLLVSAGDFESGFVLLRSRDGGIHWTEVRSLASQKLPSVGFDPRSSDVLYASTLQELIRSDDQGESWVVLDLPAPSPHFSIHHWIVDPHSPGTLWLLGHADGDTPILGLWRSEDRGAHWTLVYSDDLPIQSLAVDPLAGVLVGVPRSGALRSRDRGLHWSPAHRGLRALMADELAVAADGTVWSGAVGNYHGSDRSLLRSQDGGETWEDLRQTGRFGGGRVRAIAPSPSNPETVHVASRTGVYTTEDEGETWALQKEGLRSRESLVDLAVAPSRPSTLYVVGGLPSQVCQEGSNCLMESLVYRSNDNGGRWRRTRLELPPFDDWESLLIHPKRPGTVWIGGHGLYRSLDAGVTWTRLGSGLPGKITDLVLDPSEPDTLTAAVRNYGSDRVFRSKDGGASWQSASLGLPPGAEVRELAVDPARPATLYAATSAGVAVSDNGGKRWRLLGGTKASAAFSVAVDPSDPRRVYAGTDRGLFVLTRTDR